MGGGTQRPPSGTQCHPVSPITPPVSPRVTQCHPGCHNVTWGQAGIHFGDWGFYWDEWGVGGGTNGGGHLGTPLCHPGSPSGTQWHPGSPSVLQCDLGAGRAPLWGPEVLLGLMGSWGGAKVGGGTWGHPETPQCHPMSPSGTQWHPGCLNVAWGQAGDFGDWEFYRDWW